MTISHSSKRVLIIGREVGSIVQLIKERDPKVSVGAVDLLGNEETRFYADWKFSVEKQSPDTSILRIKHRSILDLLLELALVMLEDLEFDLLIPLAPLQTEPQHIYRLSREIEVCSPSYKILEQFTSAYIFLTNISSKFPELIPSTFTSDLSKEQIKDSPVVFVSQNGISFISSATSMSSFDSLNLSGFLLPISQIHCAFFIGFTHGLKFLGLQTLTAPHEHTFFIDHLEKNGMIPFTKIPGFTFKKIISRLSKIITQLGIVGIISFYFGLSENQIYPISCNVLPDENYDIWERISPITLVPFLFSLKDDFVPQFTSSVSTYKLPIYSHRSIKVPPLPIGLCTQRNLPGVISHPEYPICAISAISSSFSSAHNLLQQKKKEIIKNLLS
ncbi:MAG: hypothetical protein JSW11_03240 [Candidatus Heimdallarchaeota archaeon]|nr:MAG: hypothetical protein JSW11_03240 [Candidatus Heimdallarchaeota archaeon]